MYDEEDIKKLKKQIHFLKGQIEGIEKMLNKDRDLNDVFTQTKAIEGGVQRLVYDVLGDVLRKELAEKVVKALNACPGNCPDAEKIKMVQKDFPNIELKKVAKLISEMNEIEKRLGKINKDEEKRR